MLKGLYSAASGMMGQMFQTDAIAHNLANINSAGFKRSSVQFGAFGDALVNAINNNDNTPIGNLAQGVVARQTFLDFAPGDFTQTGNPLDVGINGKGFFNVTLPNGQTGYTRNGRFAVNSDGILTTQEGNALSGESGPIQIPKGTRNIVIKTNGEVVADGNAVGKLRLTEFENPTQELTAIGGTTFTSSGEGQPALKSTVEQGMLEQSNANAITELIGSINGVRTYEMLQKSIHVQNETLGKAINEVGRPR